VSRDYHAKRLARQEGIPYTEALRRVRAAAAEPAGRAQLAEGEADASPGSSADRAASS
jgi:hypothetical protein